MDEGGPESEQADSHLEAQLHIDAWEGLFWSNRVPDDMWSGLVQPIPWIVVFLGVAWLWFRRKDVLA